MSNNNLIPNLRLNETNEFNGDLAQLRFLREHKGDPQNLLSHLKMRFGIIYTMIVLSGLSLILLIVYPDLDIKFSEFFYSSSAGFIYQKNPIVLFVFQATPIATKIFLVICLSYILFNLIQNKGLKKTILSSTFYLVITIAVGPGLIVNYILKDHFGRARPSQIAYFHGTKEFAPAFSISNQCNTNCSFSSGHAAISYYYTSLAYIVSSIYFIRIYSSFIIFGSIVGFTRILMGGHFLSDVIASCFIILIINHLFFLLWQKLRST